MESTRTTRYAATNALLLLATALPGALCRGEAAMWDDGADVDAWVYSNTSASGHRERGPSFGGAFVDPQTMRFEYGTATGASRLGMALMAYETADQIPTGLDPARYSVTAVTVTAWARKGGLMSGTMIYTDQPLSPAELLSESLAGSPSSQKPMELFGVGFREGYEGFNLGIVSGERLFDEDSEVYGGNGGTYVTFPTIADELGQPVDVSNSYTGGYSATAPGEFTAPFNATPWSIGTSTVAVGAVLPNNAEFTFDLDLSQPGVLSYLQRSLSVGAVGFMLSSMHSAGQEGSGGTAYPDWRLREGAAGSLFATLSIEYEVLATPGDFDGNGIVDHADYAVWAQTYGSSVSPGTGADGNGDGIVDAADYTFWRNAIPVPSALAVPEPAGGMIAVVGLACLSLLLQSRAAIPPLLNLN